MSAERLELLRAEHNFTWEKEGWFLPLAAVLEGVGPAEAAWQPPGGGNTIWQTVSHLNYYNERYLKRITGAEVGPAAADNTSTFTTGSPEEAQAWAETVAKTREIAEGYTKLLAEMAPTDLDKPLGNGTVGWLLPSLILHNAYHTGQIALIRKMQGSWPARREE